MANIPNSLYEKYSNERVRLYGVLEKIENAIEALIDGNVSSYSLGNRSLTYQNINDLYRLKDETEARIEDLEAKLSGRSERGVFTNVFLDPSIMIPRK